MSKGHGSVQRATLAYLAALPREHTTERIEYAPFRRVDVTNPWPAWTPVKQLAGTIFGTGQPSRAQAEAVRRSVKRLAEDGLAELGYGYRSVLLVRPPLTEAEREAQRPKPVRDGTAAVAALMEKLASPIPL